MKSYRKINSKFVCEECNGQFNTKSGLGNHIKNTHNMTIKCYFDKWIKEEGDDVCIICGGQTRLIRTDRGYERTCSSKCSNIHTYNQTKLGMIKKYGVENPYQSEEVKKKCEKVMFERYGVKHPLQSPTIMSNLIQTNIRKYGCKSPMGNPDSFDKQQRVTKSIKQYKDTNIWYQASYELDFLDKYYNKYPDIKRGPHIKYEFNGKSKTYYSDFYIPSLNLIVEIKNSWLYNRDINIIKEKEKSTISNGFDYCIIIDKDYSTFEEKSSLIT